MEPKMFFCIISHSDRKLDGVYGTDEPPSTVGWGGKKLKVDYQNQEYKVRLVGTDEKLQRIKDLIVNYDETPLARDIKDILEKEDESF